MWRGSLLPRGCEAALVLCTPFPKTHRSARFYGGRAAEQEQAPSPQGYLASYRPVIDSEAPLRELHNCAAERLNAVLQYLNLMACTSPPDYAENDINTVTNISRILLLL
ncbi:hypothetical protein J2X87_005231 [Pseudomonas synxantha]|uniref:Uncharacterized protein n=1 Tax=Pseudomonas synxantha TaxID=47883 RepID=A0ACC6JUZ2_9PSED|nr:hypothetical protein [Pseudomonas synxantha]